MEKIKDERTSRAMYGVNPQEIVQLSEWYEPAYEKHLADSRPERCRKVGGGRKGTLPTAYDKVCFCLFYLKTYPTFDVLAAHYGIKAGAANRLLHNLLPVFLELLNNQGFTAPSEFRCPEEQQQYFKKKT